MHAGDTIAARCGTPAALLAPATTLLLSDTVISLRRPEASADGVTSCSRCLVSRERGCCHRPARLLAGCSLCRRVAFHAARGPVFTRLLKAFWLFPGFSIRNGAGTRERAQAVCGGPRGAAPAHRKACVLSKLPDSFNPGKTDVGHHLGRRWCATVF